MLIAVREVEGANAQCATALEQEGNALKWRTFCYPGVGFTRRSVEHSESPCLLRIAASGRLADQDQQWLGMVATVHLF
jgi:hypothetical protein